LAYFDWFKKRADPEGRPVGLFATALDEAFLENAYLGHDRQLKALVAFVDPGSAPPEKAEKDAEKAPAVDYRRFEAFGFNLKDRLLDLRNRYELAYLESWKARVTASPLWTEGHAWDQAAGEGKRWPEFQRDLAAGLGRSTIEILAEDVRKSAVHTAKHVTVIPVERRRSAPGHAWSVVLDAYRRKEDTGENLAKILIEFQRALVANLDAEDPAKALAEVRRKRTLWLDLKIEDFRRQNRLEGDLFTQKLLDLAESGKRVLAADCLREFRKDWSETAGPWNAKLAGKFPFDGDRRVDASRLAEGKVEQVAPDDLRQVLRPGGKIRAMCDRYLACFPDVNDAYGLEAGRPRIAFLQACQALQRLLFAEGTGDYQEVKFKVILPGDPGSSTRADASSGGRDVYSLNPFCVRFATGAGAKEEARLYVSTRSVEDLAWTPGAGGSERGFTVVEVLDPERTPLRDNGVPLTFKVEGPWSFLLFLRAFGTPIEDGQSPKPHLTPKAADRRSWFVRCPLGKDEPDRGPVIVYFLVELATAMEPLPDWNEANGAR
jgi:hypothetical protein